MRIEWVIAKRFIFTQKNGQKGNPSFLSLFSALGVALGTAALILALGIVQGFSKAIEEKLIGFGSHLLVGHLGDKRFTYSFATDSLFLSFQNVDKVSPFLRSKAILKSLSPAKVNMSVPLDAIILKGIDPSRDVSFLKDRIVSGRFLDSSTTTSSESSRTGTVPIVIGKKLARQLALRVGDLALLLAPNDESDSFYEMDMSVSKVLGLMKLKRVTIEGIYETGLGQGFDEVIVLMPLKAMQTFIGVDDVISGYEIRLNDFSLLSSTEAHFEKKLAYPLYVQNVYQLYSNIISWLKLQENIIPLLLLVLTIVASFNIISTLLIFVLERTEEIGILLTIGFEPKRIRRIFISQSIVLGSLGILAGNALAFSLTVIEKKWGIIGVPSDTYYVTELPLSPEPSHYLVVSVIAILICFVASALPAYVASRLKPIEALRL